MAGDDRNIFDLALSVAKDAKEFAGQHLTLLCQELKEKKRHLLAGFLLAVTGVFIFMAGILAAIAALIIWLSASLSLVSAAAAVAGILAFLGLIFLGVGLWVLRWAGLLPRKLIQILREDIQWLKGME